MQRNCHWCPTSVETADKTRHFWCGKCNKKIGNLAEAADIRPKCCNGAFDNVGEYLHLKTCISDTKIRISGSNMILL